jgi:hypothetical protein
MVTVEELADAAIRRLPMISGLGVMNQPAGSADISTSSIARYSAQRGPRLIGGRLSIHGSGGTLDLSGPPV